MSQQDTKILDRSSNTALLPIVVGLSILGLTVAQLAVSGRYDLPRLVGDRSDAIFDLWSLQHFCAGVLLGTILLRSKLIHFPAWKELAMVVALFALSWEATELAMEAGATGHAIAVWKGSFEHWGNRLVGDPLMVISGALIARRFSYAWKIVLLPAAIWLVVNVSSPNSMYIQHWLFG
jgi:hypothetical protein